MQHEPSDDDFLLAPEFSVRRIRRRAAELAITTFVALFGEKDQVGQLVEIAPSMMDCNDNGIVEVLLGKRLTQWLRQGIEQLQPVLFAFFLVGYGSRGFLLLIALVPVAEDARVWRGREQVFTSSARFELVLLGDDDRILFCLLLRFVVWQFLLSFVVCRFLLSFVVYLFQLSFAVRRLLNFLRNGAADPALQLAAQLACDANHGA